jgi:DNA modification methylase
VWDKREELIPSNNFADCEIVWLNLDKPARIFRQLWSGWSRSGERKEELLRRIHPTQKPVGIHIKILEYISDDEESVLDLFSGSGPTLIACEWLNRTCYTMEIDPHYCDVIIDRWETYTGQKAVKL